MEYFKGALPRHLLLWFGLGDLMKPPTLSINVEKKSPPLLLCSEFSCVFRSSLANERVSHYEDRYCSFLERRHPLQLQEVRYWLPVLWSELFLLKKLRRVCWERMGGAYFRLEEFIAARLVKPTNQRDKRSANALKNIKVNRIHQTWACLVDQCFWR